MQRQLLSIAILAALGAMMTGCQQDAPAIELKAPELPVQLANYSKPDISPTYFLYPSRYHVTDAGATLGRVLFYDKILSRDNTVSCGSCHLQEHAFSDVTALSRGIDGQMLTRNTPAITNVYDDPFLFWDGRVTSLKDLVLKPIRNHREMGLDNMDFLMAKISKAPYYAALYEQAYGKDGMTAENTADALAQFLSSMISGHSKYDDVMAGTAQFTQAEQQGSDVFFGEGRCYLCHAGIDFNARGGFTDPIFINGWPVPAANIGLDKVYTDHGMGEFDASKEGVFKIPSLRNVAMTAPYMHDGRFATLDDVIAHYSDHIADHPNLASELRDWSTGEPMRLNLSEQSRSASIAFLNTLTDESIMNDQKFSDPFK